MSSMFDKAKEKAEDLAGQAREKFGNRDDERSDESGQSMRDRAEDTMREAKDRFQGGGQQ